MTVGAGSLPHQIPFRVLSGAANVSERSASGTFLVSHSDALLTGTQIPPILLIESMAQLAGAIVFGNASAPAMLSAIDAARIERPLEPGDRLQLDVELEVSFGNMHRFRGTASLDGAPVASGTFVLTAMESDR